MDQRRFDDLARSLGAQNSRRAVLKGLLAGAAGGVVGLLGGGGALAAKGGGGPHKPDCCPDSAPRLCNNQCVDTTSDPNNCNGCGNVCPTGATCQNGVCMCPTGTTLCGGACVDTSSDAANCGACGNACTATETCINGSCQANNCDDGNPCTVDTIDSSTGACAHTPVPDGTPCVSNTGNGTCVSGTCVTSAVCTPDSTQNCYTFAAGAPGTGICRSGTQTCQSDGTWGTCVGEVGPQPETCNGLDDDCDGQVDNGATCPSGTVCQNGTCVGCPTGTTECGGACVDTSSDPNNCGACNVDCGAYVCLNGTCLTTCTVDSDCAAGNTCQSGTCVATCPAGEIFCNGVCVNTATDPNNCGACGNQCVVANGIAACTNGACTVASCNPGFLDCDNNPANGCEVDSMNDPNNCGACGNVCTSGDSCAKGSCQATVNCDDGNVCTADTFDPSTGQCTHTAVASGTSCQADACVGDTLHHLCVCDGAGSCVCQVQNCAPYTCEGSACATSCSADVDCAAGFYCDASACVPKLTSGAQCTASNQCISGNCSGGSCA